MFRRDPDANNQLKVRRSALTSDCPFAKRLRLAYTADVTLARAHSNIALIKYWGKADAERNLPAVPSLSMTLDALFTDTRVDFLPNATEDEILLDGHALLGRPKQRIVAVLDQFRARAGVTTRCRILSTNNFPTAAGLASSASGFAALIVGLDHAFASGLSVAEQSSLARQASASAARSLFGGFVELDLGQDSATPVTSSLDLRLLVAVTQTGPKAIGSTEAMQHTKTTSPYYSAWVEHSVPLFERAKQALLAADFEQLGRCMEHSTLMMHASMLAADPAVFYPTGASLAVIQAVRELRAEGRAAYFTMDAGPHVKVFTTPTDVAKVEARLKLVPGVLSLFSCRSGPAASIVELE